MSVRPFAWNSRAPTGRIFIKFGINGFSWSLISTDFHEIWYWRIFTKFDIDGISRNLILTDFHLLWNFSIFVVKNFSLVIIWQELRVLLRVIFRTCPDQPWGPPSPLYNGYQVFPGGKERSGRDAEPSPLLVPWSRKIRTIPLLPLWTVPPVQSLSACTVQLYLYSPYGPYGLYRTSVPV